MHPFLELLNEKITIKEDQRVKEINYKIETDFEMPATAETEVGLFLQFVSEGHYPREQAYDFLYKFIEFYEEDDDSMTDIANLIVYAVASDWIDAIDGSRLVGSLWTYLGYPEDLVAFIGTEGEVEHLDNKLRSKNITSEEIKDIERKLSQIRLDLRAIANKYIENNTI
jgi:hypothetical protein